MTKSPSRRSANQRPQCLEQTSNVTLSRARLAVLVLLALLGPLFGTASAETEAGGSGGMRDQYHRAIDLYQQGKYAAAIPELKAVYARRQLPRLLCYLGLSYRGVGRTAEALHYLELCLQTDTKLGETEQADLRDTLDRIRKTQQALDEEQKAPQTAQKIPMPAQPSMLAPRAEVPSIEAAQPPVSVQVPRPAMPEGAAVVPQPARPKWHPRPGFWAGLGIAGGLGVAAAVTGGLALDAAHSYQNMPAPAVATSTTALGDLLAMDNAQRGHIRTLAIGTDVLLGAAVLTAGITLAVGLTQRARLERATRF